MKRYLIIPTAIIAVGIGVWVWHTSGADYQMPSDAIVSSEVGVIRNSEEIQLPLSGSAPVQNVLHSIPIEEIRRGCAQQDCIPSIDEPVFVSVAEAASILEPDSLGIALSYKDTKRFYPFPMLETHELVNDVVAGDPLLISYCPLCGTGIVFDRTISGEPIEFGVSGMLWQSNLLMYNRADSLQDRNLWSQVLGQAVVGSRAGERLTIVPSDIARFSDWQEVHVDGEVLVTGMPQDPYGGDYLRTAFFFQPDFNQSVSDLAPDSYVYGVVYNEQAFAFDAVSIAEGVTNMALNGIDFKVIKSDDGVVSVYAEDQRLADVEGFWFSWQSAHPNTFIWSQ